MNGWTFDGRAYTRRVGPYYTLTVERGDGWSWRVCQGDRVCASGVESSSTRACEQADLALWALSEAD